MGLIEKRGKGAYTNLAVDKHNLSKFVLKLYGDGKTSTEISNAIELDKKIKISPVSIDNWFKRQQRGLNINEAKNLESVENFKKVCINYEHEIKTILDEVKEVKDIAKEQGKLELYAKLVDRLYRGLELLGKIMGDIKPSGSVDVNIIINKINEELIEEHRHMRNRMFNNDPSTIIDAEVEIIEETDAAEEKLKGKKNEKGQ